MILIFVILNADTQLIPQLKKELLIHRFMHSIMDLLESKTESARKLAINQLQGKTFHMIDSFRNGE